MVLVVAEDRRAEAALRRTLAATRAAGALTVITADARLAIQLRRDGLTVRLPIDSFSGDAASARDGEPNPAVEVADKAAMRGVAAAVGSYAVFDGTDFGPYLRYTLIPSFIRAVRNVTALLNLVAELAPTRIVLVGGGSLVQAARLVAASRSIPVERVAGDPLTRAQHALARLVDGRATRWVNTEFRALVLEPGFLTLLNLKGFWRRLTGPATPAPQPNALLVIGDRFTADVLERLRGDGRQTILAGATQPGRALFDAVASVSGLVPIEVFASWRDVAANLIATFEAVIRSFALATDSVHGRSDAFTVDDVSYWPLVRRASALHVLAWTDKLRHLQKLATRAIEASPEGRLLTSTDVTAYNRMLVDTANRAGMPTLGIQHGITGEPNGHSIVEVKTLAAWGAQARSWYEAEAAESGATLDANLVVTGNPRFDSLAARIASPRPAVPGPFTICICTAFLSDFSVSASEYENLVMIDTVLAWTRDKTDVRLIHKMHPGEEPAYYEAAARALGWDRLKLTTIRAPILHDILQQAHVQVSVYSSTVLEAIALGTPSIVFDAVVQRNLVNHPPDRLRDLPGVAIAYQPGDVAAMLDRLKNGPPVDRASLASSAQLRRFLSEIDGHATARVADLVRSL